MSAPWMPLYVADYLADTGHLSAAEHGAYMLLIMHYWRQGGLPTDDLQLQRIARMTPAEWRKSRHTLFAFFQEGWKHARIEDELKKAGEKSQSRAESGSRGGAAKAANAKSLKSQDAPLANATFLLEQTASKTLASSSQSQSEEEREEHASLRESAQAPLGGPEPVTELDEDADLFRRGRELLGKNAGGQIAKLKAAFCGSVPKTRAAVEQAFGRDSPSEYLAGVIRRQSGHGYQPGTGPPQRGNSTFGAMHRLMNGTPSDEPGYHPRSDWNGPEILATAKRLS